MKLPIKKRYLIPLILIAVLVLGPKPEYPSFDPILPELNIPLQQLDAYIADKESTIKNLKADNQARVVWADSIRKTPYSIVYLHGFSASQMEGDPIHRDLAKRYGSNLYLSRLAGHGIDDKESFKDLSPKDLIDSAKEAIAIGQLLGDEVIVLSCSTGGTLSAYLAAHNPEAIQAQIMYSPNIAISVAATELLTYPWGTNLLRWMNGSDYHDIFGDENSYPFWTKTYRIEGLVALEHLLNATMTDVVFKKIEQPTFIGYYFKNEEECDHVVSIDHMKDFFGKINTPEDKKNMIAFPDVGDHVIASHIKSKDLESVAKETYKFMDEVLEIPVISEE